MPTFNLNEFDKGATTAIESDYERKAMIRIPVDLSFAGSQLLYTRELGFSFGVI